MKKLFLILSLLVMTLTVMAVPAKPGLWKVLILSNGTEVKAQLVGDEHGHFWRTADGTAYVQKKGTGFYEVVDANAIVKRAKVRRQQVNAQRVQHLRTRRVGTVGRSYTGKKKGIIILVNFKDKEFKTANNNELYQRIANEEGFSKGSFKGSMADYFKAQSGGKFELDFDVVGPVTVSEKASYYGENDDDGNDMYPGLMVCEAVKLVLEEYPDLDWSQYDWNSDGYVDQVYVVYAGDGEAEGGASTTIWPHAYDLYSANYYGDGDGPVTVGTNLKVNTYACGPELNGSGKISGIGTMCHEFSHCLGYPDFYDTDYSGGWGMDSWDLMDQGSYNGDGYQPAGYTSYERWVAGWAEPIVLGTEDVAVEKMGALQDGGDFYIIYNPNNENEYFMLENRQKVGWDASLPGAGLLIIHVDYDAKIWEDNAPNDDPEHQRMTWVAADNKYQYETWQGQKYLTWAGMATDPFPSGNNNKFNKDTKPAAKFYNKKSTMSTNMTSSVEEITQNADGTISFKFVANYDNSGTGGDDPIVTPTGDYLFYESFDLCNATGGNDGKWSDISGSTELKADNNGWTARSEKLYAAKQCARFGTGKVIGLATTPAFTLNGTTTMTFMAGAWKADKDGTTLYLSIDNGTIDPSFVTMSRGAWTQYEVKVTGKGNVRISFEQEKGRFFLDEVKVLKPATTGIVNVQRSIFNTQQYYTLDGRKLNGKPTQKGIYIVNGKKIVVK